MSELEKEIKLLKSTPFWKKLWNDIKPKPRYSYGYSRWYKWKEFFEEMLWVMLAVVYAIAVFQGTYWFIKSVK